MIISAIVVSTMVASSGYVHYIIFLGIESYPQELIAKETPDHIGMPPGPPQIEWGGRSEEAQLPHFYLSQSYICIEYMS